MNALEILVCICAVQMTALGFIIWYSGTISCTLDAILRELRDVRELRELRNK
jgi:hypothetical protein